MTNEQDKNPESLENGKDAQAQQASDDGVRRAAEEASENDEKSS